MNGRKIPENFNYRRAAGSGIILFAVILFFVPRNDKSFEKPAAAPQSFERDGRLQAETDALLFLFDAMPPVRVYLTGEAVIKTGANTERGVAYTLCPKGENPTIFVKKDFYENANPRQLTNILKHELTHAWLCREGRMSGHDADFRRKFAEVGGIGN